MNEWENLVSSVTVVPNEEVTKNDLRDFMIHKINSAKNYMVDTLDDLTRPHIRVTPRFWFWLSPSAWKDAGAFEEQCKTFKIEAFTGKPWTDGRLKYDWR